MHHYVDLVLDHLVVREYFEEGSSALFSHSISNTTNDFAVLLSQRFLPSEPLVVIVDMAGRKYTEDGNQLRLLA